MVMWFEEEFFRRQSDDYGYKHTGDEEFTVTCPSCRKRYKVSFSTYDDPVGFRWESDYHALVLPCGHESRNMVDYEHITPPVFRELGTEEDRKP